jgi:hypothetical protein
MIAENIIKKDEKNTNTILEVKNISVSFKIKAKLNSKKKKDIKLP